MSAADSITTRKLGIAWLSGLALCASFAIILSGCGRPSHIDPPLFTFESPVEMKLAAQLHKNDIHGLLYSVADTHSMEPVLFGGDLIVADTREPFSKALLGKVVVYHADWKPASAPTVTHRLVQFDADGAIAEGDHVDGQHTENRFRVTAANYVGVVVGIYRLKS